MYVLVRFDGMYATPPGAPTAYTCSVAEAWLFPTAEQAEQYRCHFDETVRRVEAEVRSFNEF